MQHVHMLPLADCRQTCHSPVCRDRAKWTFPQTSHLLTGAFVACDVHLGNVARVVYDYHVTRTERQVRSA